MEMLNKIYKKYRHGINMAAILAVAAAVLLWVGYYCLPTASGYSKRQIVNDDYSVITQSISGPEGIRQEIQVKEGTRLYGVSVDFHTYNRVCFGTVYVRLEDENGNVIALADADMTSLLDNTFKNFIFDQMVYCRQDSRYTLHIYTSPQSSEDRIALWKSEKAYEGFSLTENGWQTDSTIALQYITEYVGNDIYGWFVLVSVLTLAGLETVYLMIFVRKSRIENIFAVAALFTGLIFALLTPAGGAPDEYVHIASAYKISNSIMGFENSDRADILNVRRCDAVMDLDRPVSYDAFRLADIYRGLTDTAGDGQTAQISARFADTYKPLYLAQALGISLARLLNLGFIPMLMAGRLFNLLMYIGLVWLAVKIMPVYKTMLALCALLPMAGQLTGSFSYDVFVLALSFLFTALIFRLAYGKEKIGRKDMLAPAAALCLLRPAKAIYVLLGALVLIVPSGKFENKKQAVTCKTAVIAAALICWGLMNLSSAINTLKPRQSRRPEITYESSRRQTLPQETEAGLQYPFDIYMRENPPQEEQVYYDPESDLMPNGDSKYYYSIPYILQNMKQTVKLVLSTITTQSGKYLQTMLGTRFGEIIVVDLQASFIWFMMLAAILILSVVPVKDRPSAHRGAAKYLGLAIFAAVCARTVAVCIMWTPINYETIFGIQGRYFLPALPLALFALSPSRLKLEKNIDGGLMFAMLCTDIMVVLNIFILMVSV